MKKQKTESTEPILDKRTCVIIDAVYSADVGDDDESEFSQYENSVVLLLQDVETSNVFHCPLSAGNISELANLKSEPTPRQLIKFAEALRERESPVSLLVASDSSLVTSEMVHKLKEKGLLNNNDAMEKYKAAVAKQEEIINEQKSISSNEYEEFMKKQDEQLLNKFKEWKKQKEMISSQSVFLDIDNLEEDDE
jgi:gas vesicle protein